MSSSPYAVAAVLALATGAGAWTATKTKVSAFIRVALAKRAKKGGLWQWAFDLSTCPYCTSHWLAFGAVAIWRPWIISGWLPLRFLVTSLAIVAGASLVVLVIRKALAAEQTGPPRPAPPQRGVSWPQP
jgi:hypothetical protein